MVSLWQPGFPTLSPSCRRPERFVPAPPHRDQASSSFNHIPIQQGSRFGTRKNTLLRAIPTVTLFWHSFWHLIWKYIWHKFSDILFWHSFWHSILAFFSGILSGIYSDIIFGILSGIYSDIFSGSLSDFLIIYLASILTFFPASLLALYYIWHSIWHSFWQMYLAYLLTFFLPFYLLYIRRFFVVEVRRGTLWSGIRGGGPAGNTLIRSLRWRSGGEYFDRVRRGTLRSRMI